MPSARARIDADRAFREPRHEPLEQLPHRDFCKRTQGEGNEVSAAGSPTRATVEQLGTGEGDDEDGVADRPLHDVVDEVEHARVCPLEVFEDEHRRAEDRDALEERPQAGEQLLATTGRWLAYAEERQQDGLESPAFRLVGDVLGQGRRDPLAGLLLVVGLGQAGPPSDHLAEGPERDPLAEGRRPALVPVDGLEHPIDVLEELPRQAALAHAGLPGDRHEPDATLATGRVEDVLEQSELVVTTDERRLDALAPAETASLGDDAQGPPSRHRCRLALEHLVAGRLEDDRAIRRPERALTDQDLTGRRDRLEATRGVDEIAGDHALAVRTDRHRRLACQHAGPQGRCRAGRTVQPADAVDELHRGPDGPFGVVLTGRSARPTGP